MEFILQKVAGKLKKNKKYLLDILQLTIPPPTTPQLTTNYPPTTIHTIYLPTYLSYTTCPLTVNRKHTYILSSTKHTKIPTTPFSPLPPSTFPPTHKHTNFLYILDFIFLFGYFTALALKFNKKLQQTFLIIFLLWNRIQ